MGSDSPVTALRVVYSPVATPSATALPPGFGGYNRPGHDLNNASYGYSTGYGAGYSYSPPAMYGVRSQYGGYGGIQTAGYTGAYARGYTGGYTGVYPGGYTGG